MQGVGQGGADLSCIMQMNELEFSTIKQKNLKPNINK